MAMSLFFYDIIRNYYHAATDFVLVLDKRSSSIIIIIYIYIYICHLNCHCESCVAAGCAALGLLGTVSFSLQHSRQQQNMP